MLLTLQLLVNGPWFTVTNVWTLHGRKHKQTSGRGVGVATIVFMFSATVAGVVKRSDPGHAVCRCHV